MKKSKKNHRIALIFLLCIILGVVSYQIAGRYGDPAANSEKISRRDAPKFQLPDAQGKKFGLENFKGNLTLLHFWASWCAPCLDEIPQWVELGTVFQGKKVQLVAISLDQSWEEAHKILPSSRLPKNVLSLIDLSGKVPDDFGTYQFPETYLISPDSKILFKWVGPQNWTAPETRGVIEGLL